MQKRRIRISNSKRLMAAAGAVLGTACIIITAVVLLSKSPAAKQDALWNRLRTEMGGNELTPVPPIAVVPSSAHSDYITAGSSVSYRVQLNYKIPADPNRLLTKYYDDVDLTVTVSPASAAQISGQYVRFSTDLADGTAVTVSVICEGMDEPAVFRYTVASSPAP